MRESSVSLKITLQNHLNLYEDIHNFMVIMNYRTIMFNNFVYFFAVICRNVLKSCIFIIIIIIIIEILKLLHFLRCQISQMSWSSYFLQTIQETFTCSKSKIKAPGKVWNMLNKVTRLVTLFWCLIVNFGDTSQHFLAFFSFWC